MRAFGIHPWLTYYGLRVFGVLGGLLIAAACISWLLWILHHPEGLWLPGAILAGGIPWTVVAFRHVRRASEVVRTALPQAVSVTLRWERHRGGQRWLVRLQQPATGLSGLDAEIAVALPARPLDEDGEQKGLHEKIHHFLLSSDYGEFVIDTTDGNPTAGTVWTKPGTLYATAAPGPVVVVVDILVFLSERAVMLPRSY